MKETVMPVHLHLILIINLEWDLKSVIFKACWVKYVAGMEIQNDHFEKKEMRCNTALIF